MTLDAGHLAALRNLADKRAGEDVDWINIADARALTDLGLAQRNREGWAITAAGLAALESTRDGDPVSNDHTISNIDGSARKENTP